MQSKKNTITITVAIAAYNAEKNIKSLIEAMLMQKGTLFELQKVIINSDSSTDKTDDLVAKIKNKKVLLSRSKERFGFAGVFKKLTKMNRSELLVMLNDDIVITDKLFLEKISKAYFSTPNVGLICCNAQPYRSGTFISEAVRSGYMAYKKVSETTRGGNNVFTVDGKVLCMSSALLQVLTFPKDYTSMGNVDKYIYFSAISNGLSYKYVFGAKMYFKCPTTVSDFTKWQIRNYKSNKYIVKETWGGLVDREYEMSKKKFAYYKLIEFIKNPIGSGVILLLGMYCSYKAKIESNVFSTKWDLVTTTKDL